MVGDQDQLPCLTAPDGTQHRAAVRLQPLGGERDALLDRQITLLPGHERPVRLRDVEAPVVAAHQLGTQHVVVPDEGREDLVEGVRRQVRRGVEHDGLDEAVDGVRGLAEPLHDGRSHDGSGGDVAVVRGGDVLTARDRGQGSHGAVAEDLACRDVEALVAQGAQQGDRQDAVAAELEEVLVDADLVEPQDLRDRGAHRALVVGGGPDERTRFDRGLGQGVAVELAVGGERELLHHDEVGRHHVLDHVLAGPRLDLVRPQVLAAGGRDDVADEVGAARRVLLRDDAGVPDPGVFGQAGLDVLYLQSHAADLDLVVGAAQEVQRAVRGEPCEVTGAVQPGAVGGEGVGHEPGGGQAGGAHVSAAQQEAAHVQFAADPDRHRAQLLVQDVQLGVGVGLADRRRQAFRGAPVDDVRDTDRRLGGAVAVVHGDVELGAEPLVQLGGEHLAAAPHVPQAVQAAGVARHLQQHVQHGRHQVGEGDALLGDDAQQMVRVAFATGAQDHQPAAGHQGQEDLVDGDVEGQRRLEQRRVVVPEAQDLVHLPQQALADRLVPDHRALGPPGRTGREDHIRQGVAEDGDAGALGRVGGVPPVAEVDGHGLRFGRVVFARGVELQDDPGVLDDDGPARGGPLRVERHERASGLECGEQPDHHVGGAGQGDTDDLFVAQSACDEVMGQLAGEFGRLAVGQRPVLVDDGDGVRSGQRLLPEHLDDGRADPVGLVVVPLGQGPEPGGHAGRADGAEGPVREVGEVVERELRVGRGDTVRDGDTPAVRAHVPTAGRRPAVVDPSEDVGEERAGREVDTVGALPRGPVRQTDGAGFGDGPVRVVTCASADICQAGGRKQCETSARFQHRRLSVPSRMWS